MFRLSNGRPNGFLRRKRKSTKEKWGQAKFVHATSSQRRVCCRPCRKSMASKRARILPTCGRNSQSTLRKSR